MQAEEQGRPSPIVDLLPLVSRDALPMNVKVAHDSHEEHPSLYLSYTHLSNTLQQPSKLLAVTSPQRECSSTQCHIPRWWPPAFHEPTEMKSQSPKEVLTPSLKTNILKHSLTKKCDSLNLYTSTRPAGKVESKILKVNPLNFFWKCTLDLKIFKTSFLF